MSTERHIETFSAEWNGLAIQITWEPSWLNLGDCLGHDMGHLQVESTAPEKAPLPIAEIGYARTSPRRRPSHRSAAPSPTSSHGSTRKATRPHGAPASRHRASLPSSSGG